jgi:hypothetical protein
MKGTIRLALGMLAVMGGVGGIEASTAPGIPLESLGIVAGGLLFMFWGVTAMNKKVDNTAV